MQHVWSDISNWNSLSTVKEGVGQLAFPISLIWSSWFSDPDCLSHTVLRAEMYLYFFEPLQGEIFPGSMLHYNWQLWAVIHALAAAYLDQISR